MTNYIIIFKVQLEIDVDPFVEQLESVFSKGSQVF